MPERLVIINYKSADCGALIDRVLVVVRHTLNARTSNSMRGLSSGGTRQFAPKRPAKSGYRCSR